MMVREFEYYNRLERCTTQKDMKALAEHVKKDSKLSELSRRNLLDEIKYSIILESEVSFERPPLKTDSSRFIEYEPRYSRGF